MSNIPNICRLVVAGLVPASWKSLPVEGRAGGHPDSKTVFLHFGDTPTLHYYWKNRYPSALFLDTSKAIPDLGLLSNASSILIVRHISGKWLRALVKLGLNVPVILFLDDDLPGILDDPHIPFRYAAKTAYRFGMSRTGLQNLDASVLVATPALAEKFGLPPSAVVPPRSIPVDAAGRQAQSPSRTITVFYHGTASHRREIRWLREVMEPVLNNCPEVVFEVFGTSAVKKIFSGLERVRVVHPMSWQEFFAYSSSVSYDIGLAPLLDSAFNAYRGHVKFYDISRTGAVGVYSESPVFRRVVNHGENGLLLPNRTGEWVSTICDLVGNTARRQELQKGARASVASEVPLVEASA